jgi:hypothetical protein
MSFLLTKSSLNGKVVIENLLVPATLFMIFHIQIGRMHEETNSALLFNKQK